MLGRSLLWAALTFCFLLLGFFQPSAILLDMPFGLAFYGADELGMWQQGIRWAVNNRGLAIFCFLVWPLFVSTLLGYVTASIATKIWFEGNKYSHLYSIVFIAAVFGLILAVRVTPASYWISFYGYWTAN